MLTKRHKLCAQLWKGLRICDLAQEDQLGGGDGALEVEGRAQLHTPCCTAQLGRYMTVQKETKKTVGHPSRTAVVVVT